MVLSYTEEKDPMHELDKMGASKLKGGMKFKDLEVFNTVLLTKRVWRILEKPNSLVAKNFKERYFMKGNLLDASTKGTLLLYGKS